MQKELRSGRTAAASGSSKSEQSNAEQTTKTNYVHGMTLTEAVQILNVKPELDTEEIVKKFAFVWSMTLSVHF